MNVEGADPTSLDVTANMCKELSDIVSEAKVFEVVATLVSVGLAGAVDSTVHEE